MQEMTLLVFKSKLGRFEALSRRPHLMHGNVASRANLTNIGQDFQLELPRFGVTNICHCGPGELHVEVLADILLR